MVFNTRYDDALWLMLCGNKVERTRIADFIRNIPEELYSQIRLSIRYYQNNVFRKSSSIVEIEKYLSGEFKTSGDMLYWYEIDYQTGALSLGESIDDGEERYNLFQMTLYPLNFQAVMEMSNLDNYLLGDITYNYAEEYIDGQLHVTDCEFNEFHLIKLPFGKVAINSCEMFPDVKNRYAIVNINKLPHNYHVSNLKDGNSLNRLVRGRRKKNRNI